MSVSGNGLYKFGEFRLDAVEKLLWSDDRRIPLTPKVFEMLQVFLESDGKLISKEDLMNKIWVNNFVEESNLTFTIRRLRKILNDDAHQPKFIETVPRRGYRFIAEVSRAAEAVPQFPEAENTGEKSDSFAAPAADSVAVPESDVPPTVKDSAPNRKYIAFGLTVFLLITFLASGAIYREAVQTIAPDFSRMEFSRITNDGRAILAAISPDGKYIVHVRDGGGTQSLLVRQAEETKDIAVVEPQFIQYWGITVAPDNQRIFYTAWEANKSDAVLYQVPILGGTPRKVLEMIDSAVSFSPDGKKIAYLRTRNSAGISELVTAKTDGTEIDVLATRRSPETFDVSHGSPAWSPDGESIAAVGASTTLGVKSRLIAFDVGSGGQKNLTEQNWVNIEQVEWLRDQSGLLMNAGENSFQWRQIWHVSFPDGEARKITNDLNDYAGVRLTADSKKILTVQQEQITHHWITPDSDLMNGRPILSEAGKNAETEGVAWSPEGSLILRFSQNNQDSIWRTDADGGNPKQLTFDSNDIEPTVSADGETIIFSSKQTGIYRLWRTDKNGENRRLLTDEASEAETFANCSPVAPVCVYQRGWKNADVYRISLTTGEKTSLTDRGQQIRPAISPDGKQFAFYSLGENDVWSLAIASIEDGAISKQFPIAETVVARYVRWTPDGENIAYIDTQNKVSNIVLQPLNGGEPRRITDFKAEEIFYFDWSRDGRRFAVTRGTLINNVVAISYAK